MPILDMIAATSREPLHPRPVNKIDRGLKNAVTARFICPLKYLDTLDRDQDE